MHVSFDHKEISHGLFRKKIYTRVYTTVQFSDEELAIIKNRKLKDFVIWKREPSSDDNNSLPQEEIEARIEAGTYTLTIGNLMKGKRDEYTCASPAHAKNYEQELTAKLKELKDFIIGSASLGESKSIEL